MLSFECDYTEGAHEKILARLLETNMEQLPGYGNDFYCQQAKEKIRKACGCPEAEIFFTLGGTQTNDIVIDSMLHAYEGVVAAKQDISMRMKQVRSSIAVIKFWLCRNTRGR